MGSRVSVQVPSDVPRNKYLQCLMIPAAAKPNYLIALSNILRSVPSTVILTELGNILPLLLQSLDLPDPSVKSATIETLFVTIRESADAIKEHVSSLVSRLLTTCTDREQNPPRVRASALRCLSIFPGAIRNELLLPFKRKILRSLASVLDDPKRTVRKEVFGLKCPFGSLFLSSTTLKLTEFPHIGSGLPSEVVCYG